MIFFVVGKNEVLRNILRFLDKKSIIVVSDILHIESCLTTKGEQEVCKQNYRFHRILVIGVMLFALFFGAGIRSVTT